MLRLGAVRAYLSSLHVPKEVIERAEGDGYAALQVFTPLRNASAAAWPCINSCMQLTAPSRLPHPILNAFPMDSQALAVQHGGSLEDTQFVLQAEARA